MTAVDGMQDKDPVESVWPSKRPKCFMSAKEIVEKMRDMDWQIIDGHKSNIFRETANLIESQILAARELLAAWDRNYGRMRESMGDDNPRLQAVKEKIERLRML